MWLTTLLVFSGLRLSTADRQSFITLRDEKFEGPDKKLTMELLKRRTLPAEELASFNALLNLSSTRPVRRPDADTARRRLDDIMNAPGLRSGKVTTQKMTPQRKTITDLILFLIYNVRDRLEDLRPILEKYENDARLRFGHIFCTLDKWRTELLMILVSQTRRKKKKTLASFIVYYQHLLAKNMDITYTIEHLIYLQNEFKAQMMKDNGMTQEHMNFYNQVGKNNGTK